MLTLRLLLNYLYLQLDGAQQNTREARNKLLSCESLEASQIQVTTVTQVPTAQQLLALLIYQWHYGHLVSNVHSV